MKRKLNYIFSQVIDNYKDAYQGSRPFYISFGLLFIAINAGIYFVPYMSGMDVFMRVIPEYNEAFLVYSYLLLLILPCLATLKKGEAPLKFGTMLSENIGAILGVIVLAVGGVFLMGVHNDFSRSDGVLLAVLYAVIGGVANILTIFIILFLLRTAIQKQINFIHGLIEAFIVTIILFPIIQEFYSFVVYGVLESFSNFVLETNLVGIVLIPIFFVWINVILSPLLVCIITTVISYEEKPEVITETSANESF